MNPPSVSPIAADNVTSAEEWTSACHGGVRMLCADLPGITPGNTPGDSSLAETPNGWRLLVEQSRDGIVVLDRNGRVYWVNESFAAMLGCTREEVRRLSVRDWDSQIPADALANMIESVGGAGHHFETEHRRRDGSTYEVEICTNAVIFGDEKLVLCICRDISDRKRNERQVQQLLSETKSLAEKLAQQQDTLVQAEKLAAIGRLAAGVAHEINNPLAFILSNLSSLKQYIAGLDEVAETVRGLADAATATGEQSPSASAAAELRRVVDDARVDYPVTDAQLLLTDIIDGIERIHTIVNQLRVFTHVDDRECDEITLPDLVNAAVSLSRGEWGSDCRIIVDLEEGLPPFKWHGRAIERALANLLINAAQATDTNGLVRVGAHATADGRVALDVADNGVGISEQDIHRVFDPFFSTKDVGQGAGLGLHVAHAIVERHGGSISVASRVGAGTTFTILLPLQAPTAESPTV